MNVTTRAYNYCSEISSIIKSEVSSYDSKNVRFIIPSRKDKFFWHERAGSSDRNLWTWQEIYEDICRAGSINRKRVLSPPDHLLILKSILNSVLIEYREKISELPGILRPGFSAVLSEDIRELLNEAVDPEHLPHDSESNNPSEFLLPEVYSRYIDYLNNNNLIDSAQIYTAGLEVLKDVQNWGRDLVILFVGFMSFNHGQLKLVHALSDRCREIIIIKPEANLAKFHDADSQFQKLPRIKKSSGKIIELPSAEPDIESEVIARTLALWSNGEWEHDKNFPGFDSVGIMISTGREDSFAEAFRRYGIPYDFTRGIKINLTLPGRILSSIKNLTTLNFPAYETAMLLTQPCFAGVKFPVMRAYRAGCSGLDGWEKYLQTSDDEIFSVALCAIQAIRKFHDSLSQKNTPAKIMRAFHEFLTTKNLWLDRFNKSAEFPELDEAIRTTASAIQTVGEKVLALDELMPDLGPVQDDKLSGDEAYDFLEDWCKNSSTRAPLQISNAVRIFTGSTPVLASFPVWFMTGVTQKSWSGNVRVSPLLGIEERSRINANEEHLPTLSEKASQREALFRRMIHTGESVTIISRPELDDEGRPVSESPFMQRFLDDMPEWKRYRANLSGINILLGNDNFIFPEIDPGEKIPRYVPVVRKKASAVGASDIHELLSCSFLWWQKRQANLYTPDSDIVSPAEWGIMLHLFWENVWRTYRKNLNASGKVFINIANDEWEKLLQADEEGIYKNYCRLIKDFRLRRHIDGLTFRVERLANIQGFIIDNFLKDGYEYKNILLEDEAQLKSNIDGVTFLGQCDRIEILESPEGEEIAFIADYKEGTGINSEKSMKIKSYSWNFDGREKFNRGLQLSTYAALFERNMPQKLSGVYILGLENGKISGSFSGDTANIFRDYKSDEFKEYISDRCDEGEYAMKCAASVLRSGEFMPEYNSDSCKYCHIKSLCRKGEFRGEIISDYDDEE